MQQLVACPGIDELECHWFSVTDGQLCGHCRNLRVRRANKVINARKRVHEKQQRHAIHMLQLTKLIAKSKELQKQHKQEYDNLVAKLRTQASELSNTTKS